MKETLLAAASVLSWGLSASSLAQAPADVLVVLDNSGTMYRYDTGYRIKPAVTEFVDNLRGDVRIGLIIFDTDVDYAVELTTLDERARGALAASVDRVDFRGRFTNSPAALERAIYELKTAGRANAAKVIVLMSDGVVDTGSAANDADQAAWMRDMLTTEAQENGIRIYTVAFPENADFLTIQTLAQKTGGEYFRAPVAGDLAGAFARVNGVLASIAPPAASIAPAPPSRPAPVGEAPVQQARTEPATLPLPVEPEAPQVEPSEDLGIRGTDVEPEAAADEDEFDLDDLSEEERKLLEEAGISVEELKAAPPGQAIIVRPGESEEPAGSVVGLLVLAGGAGVVLIALGLFMRAWRKGRADKQAAAAVAAPPVPEKMPEAFLIDVDNVTEQRTVTVGEKPIMVGRIAGQDTEHLDYIIINRPTVGRRHAVIKYKDGGFWVIDQGSVNGTFINGVRVVGERQLKHKDLIKVHKYEFRFEVPAWADMRDAAFESAEATVVASAEATMAATAAGLVAGKLHAAERHPPAPPPAAGPHAEPDIESLFDAPEARADRVPADPDATADDTGLLQAASGIPDIPEDSDSRDEEYGVEINMDAVGPEAAAIDGGSQDPFDTDASAFFDDGAISATYAPESPDTQGLFDDDDDKPSQPAEFPFSTTEVGPADELVRTTIVGPGDELADMQFGAPSEFPSKANTVTSDSTVPREVPAEFNGLATDLRDLSADTAAATGGFEVSPDDFVRTGVMDAGGDPSSGPPQDLTDPNFDVDEFRSPPSIERAMSRADDEPAFPEDEDEGPAWPRERDDKDLFDEVTGASSATPDLTDDTLLPSQVPRKRGKKHRK
jgi:hypothetical protein